MPREFPLLTHVTNLGSDKDFARLGCEALVAQGKWITSVEQNEAHEFVVSYEDVRPEGKAKAVDWDWAVRTGYDVGVGF